MIDRGGGESLAVSSCAETFEAVQTGQIPFLVFK